MSPFEIFIRDRLARLKAIVAKSNGDASLDDLTNEAWMIDRKLALAGTPLDLRLPEDQELMLGKLYGRFILRMKTKIGFAWRLDKDWDKEDEDAGPSLSYRVTAPELSNPLLALEAREQVEEEAPFTLSHSYSQAAVYEVCLRQWGSAALLADYLAVGATALLNRIAYWRGWIEYQSSLFDGIERIDPDFTPLPGTLLPSVLQTPIDGRQSVWDF